MVVHPDNPVSTLDRKLVASVFLKKTTRWPGGGTIRPVDLMPDSATRRAFSEKVIRRSVQAIKSYWQQRIFSGRDVPPPELETDAQVIRYVLKYPGAVGYVAAGTDPAGAKIVILNLH
jgi:ABC-type phosphate transport system substrate-binding protein